MRPISSKIVLAKGKEREEERERRKRAKKAMVAHS